MKRALAVILSSLLVAMPAFADRTVYAPVRLAPVATAGTILFADGTAAAPSISFSADPDTGIFRPGTNTMRFSANGLNIAQITASGFQINAGVLAAQDGTAAAPGISFSGDLDTGVYRPGTNILAFSTNGVGKMTITATGEIVVGQGHNGGSPVAGSIIGAAVAAGTSNTAGVPLTIAGGNSTGTGAGGAVIFQTSPAGSTGSTANTLTERMRITSGGTVYFGNGEFSATPVASTLRGTNGQGTDIAGAELVIQAGAGTGNAASGAVTFRTATAGASGMGTNSSSDRMRVKTNGQVRFMPLAADPAGAEDGDVYYNSATNKLRVRAGGAWVDLH